MNLAALKEILHGAVFDLSNSMIRENYISISCPLAPWFHRNGTDNNPSLSINFGKDDGTKFTCFSCGEKGTLSQLIDSYAELSGKKELKELARQVLLKDKPSLSSKFGRIGREIDQWYTKEKSEISVFRNKTLDLFLPVSEYEMAMNYLMDREIDIHVIDEFNLRFDSRSNRILFPVMDSKDKLRGMVGRTIVSDSIKYKNYLGMKAGNCLGGLNKLDESYPYLLLVEGFFDLLKCWKWAREEETNVLCTFGASVSKKQLETISGLDMTVIVGFDNDVSGDKGWRKVEEGLRMFDGKIKKMSLEIGIDIADLSLVDFRETLSLTKSHLFCFS